MKKILLGFTCLILLMQFGCQKGPYPYISKEDAQKLSSSVEPPITNVAFIYKGNIYYVADFTKPVTQITTDGSAHRFVKMSHDHSKFAYLNASNVIVVIDNTGKVITTLSQYTQVKSFDWSDDDKTLYILNDSEMAYYGPAMKLPDFIFPGGNVQGNTNEVISASVSTTGDLAYVTHTFDFFNGDEYELSIIPTGQKTPITYTNPTPSGNMDYVSFSTNEQDMVVGYTDFNSPSDAQVQLEVFTGLANSPAATFGGGSTPVYKSSINFIVGGFADAANNGLFEPSAIYEGQPVDNTTFVGENVTHSLMLTNYGVSSNILYTDWK